MSKLSNTNIPEVRMPLGAGAAEALERVPTADSDNVGNKWTPVYIEGKKFKATNEPATRVQVRQLVTEATPGAVAIAEITVVHGNPDASSPVIDPPVKIFSAGGGGGGGGEVSICVPLLTPMWFDHVLTPTPKSWIRSKSLDSDGSISQGGMYSSASYKMIYDHLLADWNASSANTKTDNYTLNDGTDVSIQYRLAADGHKICATSQIGNLNKIFEDNNIGSAWYYVLDTSGKFELPRSKYGMHGQLNYVKNPSFELPTNTDSAKFNSEKHYLYFHTGSDITSDNKMDKVTKENGFTATAQAGNVPVFGAGGQVIDGGHAIVPATGTGNDSDLVTVNYLKTQAVSFDSIYPVGSVYITLAAYTQETFPFPGTWVRIAEGKCLWGAAASNSDLGTSVSAGLPKPNVTDSGHSHGPPTASYLGWSGATPTDERIAPSPTGYQRSIYRSANTASAEANISVASDSIYGNSTTVQPPAVKVAFWQRTA